MSATNDQSAETFLSDSRRYLSADYLPRIRRAIELLNDEQIWWRANEQSNSIGNLMLHLAGNVRQWIVAGIGDMPFVRERDKEFGQRSPIPKAEVLYKLQTAVDDALEVLARLPSSRLTQHRTIQGMNVTVQGAIYHVVEHFSMHTGQILYIAKLLTAKDLRMYEIDEKGNARTTW